MDPMKKAWTILKATDFQRFLVEVFGVPTAVSIKLTPSLSLMRAISKGKLTEAITENEFEQLINLVESKQYEALLMRLEEINSNYAASQKRKHRQRSKLTHQEKFANDPEFRERVREKNRERYRKRLADPEFRERQQERQREYKRKRYANDPKFREKVLSRRKETYRRKKKEEE